MVICVRPIVWRGSACLQSKRTVVSGQMIGRALPAPEKLDEKLPADR